MKVCFLSCFGDLMQRDTGPTIRTYYLAKSLTNFGNEIHVVIPGQESLFEWSRGLWVHRIDGLIPLQMLKLFSALFGVLRHTSLYFYDVSFLLRSLRIMLKCDVVQIEQPWGSGLLFPLFMKILPRPLIVDSHDVFQSFKTKRNWLRKTLEIFVEKVAYRCADRILSVSEKERQLLIQYGVPENKICVIPNGVDTEVFTPPRKSYTEKVFSEVSKVIFVGNMEYWPNQEAVKLIEEHIAPKILEKIDNVTFFVVGRGSPENGHPLSPYVVYTGSVEDVRCYLNGADIAVAPLLHGSGTRLKILEYFSCRLPVVSTPVGVEGLDVREGLEVLIADDVDTFVDKLVDLLNDKVLCEKLGKAARELVVAKYDWQQIVKGLNDIYVSVA